MPNLSIAAKPYSIFALLAVVTLAGAVVSNINKRQNAYLGEEAAVAARAAEHIERADALVYAVVMESRSI